MALKPYGRASLIGVFQKDIAIPYVVDEPHHTWAVHMRGKMLKVSSSSLKQECSGLGRALDSVIGQFSFEEWEKVVEITKQNPESGNIVLFTPSEDSSFGCCWDF